MSFQKKCENFDNSHMRSKLVNVGAKGTYYKNSKVRRIYYWCKGKKDWIDECPNELEDCDFL